MYFIYSRVVLMTTGFVYGINDYACALIHCTYGMYAMIIRYSHAMFFLRDICLQLRNCACAFIYIFNVAFQFSVKISVVISLPLCHAFSSFSVLFGFLLRSPYWDMGSSIYTDHSSFTSLISFIF